jgi:hypothetical protein
MSDPDKVACAVQPSLGDLDDETVSKVLQLADGRIHGVASSCTRLLHMVRGLLSASSCVHKTIPPSGQTSAFVCQHSLVTAVILPWIRSFCYPWHVYTAWTCLCMVDLPLHCTTKLLPSNKTWCVSACRHGSWGTPICA